MALMTLKVVLKFATLADGVQYVIIVGLLLMLKSFVDSWDYLLLVNIFAFL